MCSCVPTYLGSPPTCRPECTSNSDCPFTRACSNQKCRDPCAGACGIGAKCMVVNHSPICSCPNQYTGSPFVMCQQISMSPNSNFLLFSLEKRLHKFLCLSLEIGFIPPESVEIPCQPSPCGPNAECRDIGGSPSCSCLPGFVGSAPHCRPECVSNSECPSNLACMNYKCKDPCPNSCAQNAECRVVSHTAMCACMAGYVGDPFTLCVQRDPITEPYEPLTPCVPSPCGSNANCREQNGVGSCQCLPEYYGNPYEGCRPECVHNSDCPSNKACIHNKCQNPCGGSCGQNAECHVVNHVPSCTCIVGYSGDPYRYCTIPDKAERKNFFPMFTNKFIISPITNPHPFVCVYPHRFVLVLQLLTL